MLTARCVIALPARRASRAASRRARAPSTSTSAISPGRALSASYDAADAIDPMSSYDGASCVVTDSIDADEIDRTRVGETLREQIANMGGEQLMDPRDFVSTDAQ